MFTIDVNSDAYVIQVRKLEELSRSAFPNAIRGTLNSMALDVKKNTMPDESDRAFTHRNKSFFKSSSRVEFANGFNVNSMRAEVGFIPFNGGSSQAVDDLNQQERGGTIKGRGFIPMDKARISGNNKRMVAAKNRISRLRNVVKVSDAKGSSNSQKLIKSVVYAGVGGHVLTDRALFRVDNLSRVSGKLKFKLTAIYSFEAGRNVRIRATHFMERATIKTIASAHKIFNKEAERQFNRYM